MQPAAPPPPAPCCMHAGVIVANILTMAATFYKEPELMIEVQEQLNVAFAGAYLVEALLKIYGGWRGQNQ